MGLRKSRIWMLMGARMNSSKLMGNNSFWDQAHRKMSVLHF